MKYKQFQKQDLARAALHDGLILSWDTGLGKTWALYSWPLLKCGFARESKPGTQDARLRPKAPILIIAPGDLHQQIINEGRIHFKTEVRRIDSQTTFNELVRGKNGLPILTDDGRPVVPPGFYIVSYAELTINGVQKLPDAMDWEPRALLDWLCLPLHGRASVPVGLDQPETEASKPESDNSPASSEAFWSQRPVPEWRNALDEFKLDHTHSLAELESSLKRELKTLEHPQMDDRWIDRRKREIYGAYEICKNIMPSIRNGTFDDLNTQQQDYVIRFFCQHKISQYQQGVGATKEYGAQGSSNVSDDQSESSNLNPETSPSWKIKCVYSPSLSDLCHNAFDCVVIDEGVKMKGEETHVGRGVRQMDPPYRLVLTATPIKNRLPDIFRLAWWAAGGETEAHARWPYRDSSADRDEFARQFMVSENNLTKEAKARREGRSGGRYKKLTAEVCQVHLLWKLLGPIVLRRRKKDCGEDIVQKIRKVIRCDMGADQKRVYQYHLAAEYRDKNGMEAIGAKLQALRMITAAPDSDHLENKGTVFGPCDCMKHGRAENPSSPETTLRSSDSEEEPSAGVSADSFDSGGLVTRAPNKQCPACQGDGRVELPHRSGTGYIPKMATTMTLIHEILERKEQVVVFSAFNDPLDRLSGWLKEANVRHVTLDGRTNQNKRGKEAALFKKGRFEIEHPNLPMGRAGTPLNPDSAIPVMLAGVECMSEGHSFHLANNVILIAYSWAYDKFKQALDRVHRMISVKDVNVYVVICQGSIDRKLESLIQEKGDSAELVLDGQLIGERTEEVNLAELLKIALREFNVEESTLDEAVIQKDWPSLRQKLQSAMATWTNGARRDEFPSHDSRAKTSRSRFTSNIITLEPPTENIIFLPPAEPIIEIANRSPSTLKLETAIASAPFINGPAPIKAPNEAWRVRMQQRAARLRQTQGALNDLSVAL